MHASHAFLMGLHAGSISISIHVFICCVQALQHHQASSAFSLGSEFPTSGKLPVSPSRIHDKHQHHYPRRFLGGFSHFCFLGTSKSELYRRLRFGDMGLRTDGSFQTLLPQLLPFSFSCTQLQHVACLLPVPSIAAGCADHFLLRWSWIA